MHSIQNTAPIMINDQNDHIQLNLKTLQFISLFTTKAADTEKTSKQTTLENNQVTRLHILKTAVSFVLTILRENKT